MERRISDRKNTAEIADLYHDDEFVQSCQVTCVSPTGVFVTAHLPGKFRRGTRVDLYFPIDPAYTGENKLLCMRGIVARVSNGGAGIRVYSKRLPMVPPAERQEQPPEPVRPTVVSSRPVRAARAGAPPTVLRTC